MGWLDEFWRDTVAVTGLLVSLAGFPFAIYHIWRSRGAAEAARDAIVHNLTAVDLERASNMIQEIRDLHRRREWNVALHQYHDLRRILADVKARHPNLTAEQQTLIQDAIVQLQTIDERVSKAEQTEGAPEAESRDEESLLNVQSMLDGLASELKQRIQVGGD